MFLCFGHRRLAVDFGEDLLDHTHEDAADPETHDIGAAEANKVVHRALILNRRQDPAGDEVDLFGGYERRHGLLHVRSEQVAAEGEWNYVGHQSEDENAQHVQFRLPH